MKKAFTIIASIAIAALSFIPFQEANASDVTLRVQGTYSSFQRAVQINVNDTSGIASFKVYYSWDHYVHIDALPIGNHVNVLESYTCINLGPCHDFIAQLGIGDNPGHEGQPHVSVHHNLTATFGPHGTGNTVVEEHFEHGGIPEFVIRFNDGKELYVDTVAPGFALGDYTAPHVIEFYVSHTIGAQNAEFVHD